MFRNVYPEDNLFTLKLQTFWQEKTSTLRCGLGHMYVVLVMGDGVEEAVPVDGGLESLGCGVYQSLGIPIPRPDCLQKTFGNAMKSILQQIPTYVPPANCGWYPALPVCKHTHTCLLVFFCTVSFR
jgi:hypothetical protein